MPPPGSLSMPRGGANLAGLHERDMQCRERQPSEPPWLRSSSDLKE